MRLYVGITDGDWYESLAARPGLEEVNFWQPSGGPHFKALEPGGLFLLKLHAPRRAIVGGGIFAAWSRLPASLAWETFGVANGAPVAAVVLGDLDTAENVTVNVPGATTTLDSTLQKVRAASGLLNSAARLQGSTSFAVVSWFGYRAPALPEVPAQGRAAAGGAELASFLDGIHDSRGGAPRRLTVLGHSYGSTTAAEALVQTRHHVDTFVTYGSVGFTDATKPEHLNVDRVYATEGQADHTAIKGRIGRTDPRDLSDVEVFSSEAAGGLTAVTGHDMYPETAGQVGYLTPGSTAQDTISQIIATGGRG